VALMADVSLCSAKVFVHIIFWKLDDAGDVSWVVC
jgi:hypothetical protein